MNHPTSIKPMHIFTESPLVTVAVPTIGRPDYFQYAVKSILSQTYWNLQVLISDNAPSVPSAELLSNSFIEDRRIEIVTRPIRLGFVDHMNLCIRDARGSYFMILSDDDQISPGYIEEMVWLMESNPSLSVSFGHQVMITEDALGLMPNPILNKQSRVVEGRDYVQDFFIGHLNREILTNFSFFTSTCLLRELGGFPYYPSGAHIDNLIVVKLAVRGDVGFGINQLFYRVYNTSTGMSMEMEDLLEASIAYTCDVQHLLLTSGRYSRSDITKLMRMLIKSNILLCASRLRRIYVSRIGLPRILRSLMRLALFSVTSWRIA